MSNERDSNGSRRPPNLSESARAQRAAVAAALGKRSVVLIGMFGAGKSSIGRRLAHLVDLPFVDADTEIEAAAGTSIVDVYLAHGEAYLRSGEVRVIKRLLEGGPQILAVGYAAFLNPDLRTEIRSKGISVWLKADYGVLLGRIGRDPRSLITHLHGPLKLEDKVINLIRECYPVYEQANITVRSQDVSQDTLTREIEVSLLQFLGVRHESAGHGDADEIGNVRQAIERTSKSPLVFGISRGRIRYRQTTKAGKSFLERKSVARECCKGLQTLCALRVNEQPQLKDLADRYAEALSRLRKDRGAYKLFIIGLQIDSLIKIKSAMASDPDRNPPLDADLVFRAQSLTVAHAGLITLFPEINRIPAELDHYRGQLEAIDALQDRVLDPVLDQLATSQGILDSETQELTEKIKELDDLERISGNSPSQAATSTKLAWLRGVLPAMGLHVLDRIIRTTKALKRVDRLALAIIDFFSTTKSALTRIAEAFQATFGWIQWLLSHLG